jgi:hypothetical protein
MTGEGIYLMQEDGALLELTEQHYESEELLQRLLERYPSLLAGRQMSPAEPRRWVLVTREAGMPSRLGGGAQWSADHVFLDQDAVPTIVEVSAPATPASAGRSSGRCWTMPPTRSCTGRWRRSRRP